MKRETITAEEIGDACGFTFDSLACKKCGGCGWFTSVGPDRPCECNPHRMSVDACFRDLERRKMERNEARWAAQRQSKARDE